MKVMVVVAGGAEIRGNESALILTVAVIKQQCAVNSMFHYALTCIGMSGYTRTHAAGNRQGLYMCSISSLSPLYLAVSH